MSCARSQGEPAGTPVGLSPRRRAPGLPREAAGAGDGLGSNGPDVLAPLHQVSAALNGPTGKRHGAVHARDRGGPGAGGGAPVDPQVDEALLGVPGHHRSPTGPRAKAPPGEGEGGHQARDDSQASDPHPHVRPVGRGPSGVLRGGPGGPRRECPARGVLPDPTLTCVNTGWTEIRALRNKAQRWCFQALIDIRASLPFPLLGLDSDNGGEFISNHLFAYCRQEAITFTRSRPERRNDNCFVEQKNWTVVRQHVGYARYDTAEELEVLTELYSHLRLWVNHFQPVMMLAEKIRDGAKVTRRYDTARTPYRRVLASEHVSKAAKRKLEAEHLKLNPAQLQRDIGRCQYELHRLGRFKEHRRRKEARAATTGSASDGSSRAAVTAQDRVGPLPAGASRKRGSQRRAEARSGKR
jgi:hypothetical protein